VEDSNKHIIEETVRQVGHLPELYEDTRSEKYIKNVNYCYTRHRRHNSHKVAILSSLSLSISSF